jgi:uncharacterized tellurite resistance protein B-like protein
MSLLKFLGIQSGEPAGAASPSSQDAESIRRIIKSLDSLEPGEARRIASFAFVLSRVANADLDIAADEIHEMERLVRDWGGLPEAQAVLVVEIARRQSTLFGGTDNFLVTRQLKETESHEEKVRLLHCLFAVSAANDSISSPEEAIIAQIASELGIEMREMTQIRAAYKDKRAVMKNLPK